MNCLEKEKTYSIYTDASFDDITKIGTYAIIIMQENVAIKTIAKKCRIQMSNAIECEIFAIYQAINVILSTYIKKDKMQKFKIKTDCMVARDFFIEADISTRIFKNKSELSITMKKIYERICKKLSKKGCSLTLDWVSRNSNKMAHKHSYAAFQRLKLVNDKNEILIIDKNSFMEVLTKLNKKQCEVIVFLLKISSEQKTISRTQKDIAESLEMPVTSINKIFQELIRLNIMEKVKNGIYALLI